MDEGVPILPEHPFSTRLLNSGATLASFWRTAADELLKTWYNLVQEYSAPALTKPIDRLPTLSGIARHFRARFHAKYLAGLGEHDLAFPLGWKRSEPEAEADALSLCHDGALLGPSWSRASRRTPVSGLHEVDSLGHGNASLIELVGTSVSPVPGGDIYGQSATGRLSLMARIGRVQRDPDPDSPRGVHAFNNAIGFWTQDSPSWTGDPYHGRGWHFLLLEGRWQCYAKEGDEYYHMSALVVREVKGLDDTYERIGHSIEWSRPVDPRWQHILSPAPRLCHLV